LFPDVVFNPIVIVDMLDHTFHHVAFAKVVHLSKSADANDWCKDGSTYRTGYVLVGLPLVTEGGQIFCINSQYKSILVGQFASCVYIVWNICKKGRCDQPSGLSARLYPMADASESRSEQGCRAFLGMH
jgi:hypothetical protein